MWFVKQLGLAVKVEIETRNKYVCPGFTISDGRWSFVRPEGIDYAQFKSVREGTRHVGLICKFVCETTDSLSCYADS